MVSNRTGRAAKKTYNPHIFSCKSELCSRLCPVSQFIVGWVERPVRCQKCTLIHCVSISLEIPILIEIQHVIFSTLPHGATLMPLVPDNVLHFLAIEFLYHPE